MLGRIDPAFHDDNDGLINAVITRYPDAKSMEMETFLLFHLANCSRTKTIATSAAIVVSCSDEFNIYYFKESPSLFSECFKAG